MCLCMCETKKSTVCERVFVRPCVRARVLVSPSYLKAEIADPACPHPTHPHPPRALKLVDLFRSYFEGPLNEGSVKRNFTLIYELLDEAMDFGFPQVRKW